MNPTSNARKRYTNTVAEAHSPAALEPAVPAPLNPARARPVHYGKATATETEHDLPPRLIVAHVDIGWGNTLFIRGEGGGLSWDRGLPMTCDSADRWIWPCLGESEPHCFKFLLNDEIWAAGENEILQSRDVTECRPQFGAIWI